MDSKAGFWAGMSAGTRVRLLCGFVYVVACVVLASLSPIPGIVLLMLPILWTVLVTWTGSEDGVNFGPHSRMRHSAFGYLLQHLWHAPKSIQAGLFMALCAVVIGGLGWVSTEKMRAESREPEFTERVTTAVQSASDATKETASGWLSNAKGWFSRDDDSP